MVVAHSTDPRNGKFVEILGTYNPVAKPVLMSIKEDRALHWLMQGAQPSETAAIVLSRIGVLEKYFEARPNAKKAYKFLDKRTSAMSVKSVIEAPAPAKETPAPAPAVEAAPAVEEAPAAEAAPAAEEAPAVEEVAEPAAEAPVEEASAPEIEPIAAAEPVEEAADSADDAPAEAESPAEEKSE
jgi:small subunit ribosomal protein S16